MAVPERRVSNTELAARLGVDEAWIARRTGTSTRPWASPGERLSDLAARAGHGALTRAGISPEELDLVIVATSTADEMSPNAAPLVAGTIGAGGVSALDVGAACSGWLAGLSIACSQIESGRARNVLLIGADLLSRALDLSDRDTAPLFADGAGASVLSAVSGSDAAIGPVLLHSDAGGAELVRLERGGRIEMNGPDTFRCAVERLTEVTGEALEANRLEPSEVDLFIYHQANSRIVHAVARRLDLPAERVVDYVDRFANSSAATLPIALAVAESEGRLHRGDRILLAAFGAGFTWGATVVEWRPRGSTRASSGRPTSTPRSRPG